MCADSALFVFSSIVPAFSAAKGKVGAFCSRGRSDAAVEATVATRDLARVHACAEEKTLDFRR